MSVYCILWIFHFFAAVLQQQWGWRGPHACLLLTHITPGFVTQQDPEMVKMYLWCLDWVPCLVLYGPAITTEVAAGKKCGHLGNERGQGRCRGIGICSQGPSPGDGSGSLLTACWEVWVSAPFLSSKRVFKFQEFFLVLIGTDLHWSFLFTAANGNFILESPVFWSTI